MSFPKTSKQWYFPKLAGYANLTSGEVDVAPPKPYEVLVKIHATSLQYRDLMISSGSYPTPGKPNVVPLSDAAGEIVAVGEAVSDWKVGDRVCANFWLDHVWGKFEPRYMEKALGAAVDGVLTEYRTFPEHSLVKIPEHLSYEEASTLPCAGLTAYAALLDHTPLKGGETVLVQGTGGVSIFALQFAVASGATVIATSSSDSKLEIAAQLGAKHLVNYKKTLNWEEEVLKATGGRGVDHVIEVGGEGTLMKSVKSLAYGGCIHLIGVVAGEGEIKGFPRSLMFKNACMHGVVVGSRAQFENMNRLMSENTIKPIVDKVFPFEEAQKAYEYLDSQKHVGKVVIKVSKD